MSTPVFDVVHMFSERGISAVPIVDENGIVVNLYESVDVIVSPMLRQGDYCIKSLLRPLFALEHTKPWTSPSQKLSISARQISPESSYALDPTRSRRSCN